jgi:hypothetical protein
VRYMPPCQLPGREAHVYTGYQLPYDPHEWDYNAWYDTNHEGPPSPAWYLDAASRQQQRHGYTHVPACSGCAIRAICDGFHPQYVARWGGDEATPYDGPPVSDPCHFVSRQPKITYVQPTAPVDDHRLAVRVLADTRMPMGEDGRAGVKRSRHIP